MNRRKDNYSNFISLQSWYRRFFAQFWPKGVLKNIVINFAWKCSEHSAECFMGSQCARFVFTKSTHFFLLLIASGRVSAKRGIVCTNTDFCGFAVFLQFATTHWSGIIARTLSRLTSFPRLTSLRPNSNPFSLNSVANQNGANFTNFENSQKIEQKCYDNFFTAVIRTKSKFQAVRNKFWG